MFISAVCWLLGSILLPEADALRTHSLLWQPLDEVHLPMWLYRLVSFVLYGLIGYSLVAFNNAFAIIRMRASVQTSVFFLLIAVCPVLHTLYIGDFSALFFLVGLYFLFAGYQRQRPSGYLFYAFLFLGVGSLVFPKLTFFAPLFWIGAYKFQALSWRSFFASVVGWAVPYWFLLGHAYFYGQMELFRSPLQDLVTFVPMWIGLQVWELCTLILLLVLYLVSAGHCIVAGYDDKIRTRSYLNFMIFFCAYTFIYIGLQPDTCVELLPILMIGVSFLAGHLFVLAHSRLSNVFFICMLVAFIVAFIVNLINY